jgi:hypothetical protein
LYSNKYKAESFLKKAPDERLKFLEDHITSASTNTASEEEVAAERQRISDVLGQLLVLDSTKPHKLFDQAAVLICKAADIAVDADTDSMEVVAFGAVKSLLRAAYTTKQDEQLTALTLLIEGFKIVGTVTKTDNLLKPVEKAVRAYTETCNPVTAVNLLKALVDFGGQCTPPLVSENQQDTRTRFASLQQALQQYSEPFNKVLEKELNKQVPDAALIKDIQAAIQRSSWSSSNYSAQAIQLMYQDAMSCIQGEDERQKMLMCAVRRAFSSSCSAMLRALLRGLPAVLPIESARRIQKIVRESQLKHAQDLKSSKSLSSAESGKVVAAIWRHLHAVCKYMPDNLEGVALAGEKIFDLQGSVLDEVSVCYALLVFREASGKHEAVSWVVQALLGGCIMYLGARRKKRGLQAAGYVALLCAVQSIVSKSGTDSDKMLTMVDGVDNLMQALSPIFPEVPLSPELSTLLQGGDHYSAEAVSKQNAGSALRRDRSHRDSFGPEEDSVPVSLPDAEYVEFVRDLFRIAKQETATMETKLQHVVEILLPQGFVPTLEASSSCLHNFVNAIVLLRPVAKEWLRTCAHMSRVVQTQIPGLEDEISEVAERLFFQGLRLVRLLHAILVIGRPFSLQRRTLEDLEKLSASVTEVMTLLAAELREKQFIDYVAEASSLSRSRSKSKRVDHFQMPSRSKHGPGHTKSERTVDRDNYIKSGQAKWLAYEEDDLAGVPAYNEEEDAGDPGADTPMAGKMDALGGLKSEELVEVDIDPDLQWIDTSLLQPAQKSGKIPRGASGKMLQPANTPKAKNKQESMMKVTTVSGNKNAGNAPGEDSRGPQDFDLSGNAETTLQAQEGVKVKVDIRINASVIREQLKNADIQEMYKNIPRQKRRNAQPVADPVSCRIKPGEKDKKWTYQRLVECEQMTKNIESVLRVMRTSIPEFFQKAKHPYQFEFLVCVDNSGSMASKERFVIEALVVLIEVLRKLEFRFAVALWGREPGKLLLDFDREDREGGSEHFNVKKGQEIIQSLTFDQPSRIASCLTSICERVWPAKVPKPPHTKRLCITLFDGFSEEALPENFADLPKNHDFNLGMLLIDEHRLTEHAALMKAICAPGCHSILDVDQVDLLHKQVVLLLSRMFELSKKECEMNTQAGDPHVPDIVAPSKEDLKGKESLLDVNWFQVTPKNALQDESLRGVGGQRSLIAVSRPAQPIPMLRQAHEDEGLVRAVRNADWTRLDERLRQHEEYYRHLEHELKESPSLADSLHAQWNKTVTELSGQIEEYVNVIEEVVAPFNKYSRRRCALKGSSLHLPGYVVNCNFGLVCKLSTLVSVMQKLD